MSAREQWLREALSELTESDASRISVTQHFAEQGLDSLVGLRLTRKLEDQLGVEVELEWLFDYPSIHELSRFLDQRFGSLDLGESRPPQDRGLDA